MFEVFIDPQTNDDFEYQHALWQLSGFIVRETYPSSEPLIVSQVADAQKENQSIKDRIRQTKKYQSLKGWEQKDVLKGIRRRDWTAIARQASFNETIIRKIYSYYSGYVHADGLSGAQIFIAQTKEEQLQFIETDMCTVMIVMSKMIIDYANKFQEAQIVCANNSETLHLANIWARAVS